MDRVIIYPGQIPLETDLLQTNKNAMLALAKLASTVLGTSAVAGGFACTPHGTSLSVDIAPGAMYLQMAVDATDYSSLLSDTTHQVLKGGHTLDSVTLPTPAPGTVGQSINYLIQAKLEEVDNSAVVLPYYNAADPTHGYSGPNDTGVAQNTARTMVVTISAKAGPAAATGSQTTPIADTGFFPLWAVTVANGAASVSSGNIVRAPASILLKHTLTELDFAGVDVEEFTSSATWTKPSNAGLVLVELLGAGGGGAGGAKTNGTGTVHGCGGGGGSYTYRIFKASELSSTVSIVIGAGGIGGVGSTTTTPGVGSNGGDTAFGSYLVAYGGGGSPGVSGGGRGGVLSNGGGTYGGEPISDGGGFGGSAQIDPNISALGGGFAGGLGGQFNSTTSLSDGGSSYQGGAGGGGGGRVNSASLNTPGAGGSAVGGSGGGAAAGTSDSTTPTNGSNASATERKGGGGGGGSLTGNGADGGNGGVGSGGGGGGSTRTGTIGGNGGNGGDGRARVYVW